MAGSFLLPLLAHEASRLQLEADLKPAMGFRFQPTGFPDLGAGKYTVRDGGSLKQMLQVESAQSMANRLEAVIWDDQADDLVPPLRGLPYVRTKVGSAHTNSILEAHRLASAYFGNGKALSGFEAEAGLAKGDPVNRPRLARALLKYDSNALVHGVFLPLLPNSPRLERALSAFIEAEDVEVAHSGGVKLDRLRAATKDEENQGSAKEGFGHVPFHREEFTAARITAYFSVDLSMVRSLRLPDPGRDLILILSLYKIARLLAHPLRLRTACDLETKAPLRVVRPKGFEMPTIAELEAACKEAVAGCREEGLFAEPSITDVVFSAKQAAAAK